jgi:hypothetical protein
VLRRAGLSYEGSFEHSVVERWSVESLIGFMYSTSVLNRTVLSGAGPTRSSAIFDVSCSAAVPTGSSNRI